MTSHASTNTALDIVTLVALRSTSHSATPSEQCLGPLIELRDLSNIRTISIQGRVPLYRNCALSPIPSIARHCPQSAAHVIKNRIRDRNSSSTMSDLFTLVLTPDNPSNTTITDGDNGKVLYRVATEHGKETVTRVQSATGGTIASWEWRDVRSDVITLGTGTPMPTSAWLKKSIIPFKE